MDGCASCILLGDVVPTPNFPGTRIDVPFPEQVVIAGVALAIGAFLLGRWLAWGKAPALIEQMPVEEADAQLAKASANRQTRSPLFWVSVILALTLLATLASSFAHIQARRNYRSPGPPQLLQPPESSAAERGEPPPSTPLSSSDAGNN